MVIAAGWHSSANGLGSLCHGSGKAPETLTPRGGVSQGSYCNLSVRGPLYFEASRIRSKSMLSSARRRHL